MKYTLFKWFTILLPTFIIGGFEYVRHEFLLESLSMEAGNAYITILTLISFYLFATWMFGRIESTNNRLAKEQAKRAVYEERERLAAELHDNIAQTLFFLQVKLNKGQTEDAKSMISDINHDLRQAIFNLRSLPEEGADLEERLLKWLEEWSMISGVELDTRISLDGHRFTSAEEVLLFGIIQEGFTNIRKHAQANNASLHLLAQKEGWVLKIMDDGIGPIGHEGQADHYGLTMMKQRAQQLGAHFQWNKRQKGGTEIIVACRKEGALQ
ncbi:sensor histidine kinase [Paenibacillus senegalensis]|uniref:sensor histidine kinase n=1 Tax=Paenibacillus senegalensis TaxID=1465766 RepID=UPI000288E6B7|nr:histidine kinase [Paenibacillus senegalensis]